MDITRIFKSNTRKALFRLYFTNPAKNYYLRELERILGIPVSMLRKELLALEDAGIFTSQKQGNLLYYSLNESYPLFDELKSIVFKTIGVQGVLKDFLEKIKGIDIAFIYGSFAKRQDIVTSDIDLFIIGQIDEDRLVSGISKLEKELKREINYSLYTKSEFQQKKQEKEFFILDVLENPIIFLIGDKNDL
jgi:predicted nucleotidyltransferase